MGMESCWSRRTGESPLILVMIYFDLSIIFHQNRHAYQSAITAFQIALRADPLDTHAWLRLGDSYLKSGRHAAALKSFEQARALAPDDWMCAYAIGDANRQVGAFVEAIEQFRHVLKTRPSELGVLLSLSETTLALGREEFTTGYLSRAESSFIDAIEVSALIIASGSGEKVAWKVIGDATLALSKLGTLSDVRISVVAPILIERLAKEGVDARIPTVDVVLATDLSSFEASPLSLNRLSICAYKFRVLLDSESESSGSSWFDLSLSLSTFLASLPREEVNLREMCLRQAIKCIKMSLTREPGNQAFWTALGYLALDGSARLSQHAFIKAIECDPRVSAPSHDHSIIGSLTNAAIKECGSVDKLWSLLLASLGRRSRQRGFPQSTDRRSRVGSGMGRTSIGGWNLW